MHPGRVLRALMMKKKKLLVGTECYSFTFTKKKKKFAIAGFVKVWNKALNKSRQMFVRNIFSWSNGSNIGTAPSICFAVTPRLLRPEEHKINKSSFNV